MQQLFIVRDSDGRISGLSATAADGAEPAVFDDPQVQDFLRDLDIDLVRVHRLAAVGAGEAAVPQEPAFAVAGRARSAS